MSEVLLFPEVTIILFIDTLLFAFLIFVFLNSLYILKNYKKDSFTQEQYKLEKRSYLVTTIITLALYAKILLLPFFVYTLDKLSILVHGAMCALGVVNSNQYGYETLFIKIVVIFFAMVWLKLNKEDELQNNFPYFNLKNYFFIVIFLFSALEFIGEVGFFTHIPVVEPVLCCSSIYTQNQGINHIPFSLSNTQLLYLFYTLYGSIILTAIFQKRYLLVLLSVIFVYISYFVIVYIYSPLIYQLPTHKCPFCMLQSDYNYIGYFIYTSLFLATYYALNSYKKTIFYSSLFVILITYSFVSKEMLKLFN